MSDVAGVIERLKAGIQYLPRTATEGSEEHRKFVASGDSIWVNEGDFWMAVHLTMPAAADLLSSLSARIAELERENGKITRERDAALAIADDLRSRHPLKWKFDMLDAAEAKLAKAVGALEPFAVEAAEWSASVADDFVPVLTPGVTEPSDDERAAFTVGDLRRARDIVSPMPNKEG